jgi:hypothetical protein
MTNHRVAEAAEPAAAQLENRPIMSRLVPVTIYSDIDGGADKTQPRLGATLEVFDYKHEAHTIWLPASVWQGMATLVRQIPNHLRPDVAEFLMVLHGSFGMTEPLGVLLNELITEVENDPYGEMPQIRPDAFDMAW